MFRVNQSAWRMHRVAEGMRAYRERFGSLPMYLEQDFSIDRHLLENHSAEKQEADYAYLLSEWEKTMARFWDAEPGYWDPDAKFDEALHLECLQHRYY